MLSEENNETSFPYSTEQRGFATVAALKTIMLDITIAAFVFLDILIIIQNWGHLPFSSDLMQIWDSFPFLYGILELWLHRQSCCRVPSPWLMPPMALHAVVGSVLKLLVHQGGDRLGQSSGDTNLGPWPRALAAQWEHGMPGADGVTAMGMGWMQHVYAVPGEFRGTQASLQVLRERSAPVVENTNTKYFGDSQQRNWASASLLLYYFFGWLFFGCFFFLFSLLPSPHLPVSS